MFIKIGKKDYANITLTEDEIETLKWAWTIIAEIGEVLGDKGNKWIGSTTGELVCVNELARVLGILDAFAEENKWESED